MSFRSIFQSSFASLFQLHCDDNLGRYHGSRRSQAKTLGRQNPWILLLNDLIHCFVSHLKHLEYNKVTPVREWKRFRVPHLIQRNFREHGIPYHHAWNKFVVSLKGKPRLPKMILVVRMLLSKSTIRSAETAAKRPDHWSPIRAWMVCGMLCSQKY